MQISILSGIFTDKAAQIRTAYPRNLIPVPKKSGISDGYLRHTDGIVEVCEADGTDRGGINWNGVMYRVLGNDLAKIAQDGTITIIGDVGSGGQCTLDYSFDYLAVSSGGRFYLYNGSTLQQVTDADLGTVIDFIWIDGYFMTTDGEYLVVTELNDPFSVNPLKYGSSEINPDPILAVQKVRNEVAAVNRYTIEFFQNVGGDNFPFQRIEGATINKGSIGTYTNIVINDLVCFMGSALNEAISFYIGLNGQITKIATSEIEQILATYSETELADAIMEYKIYNGHIHIMTHLGNETLVYDVSGSEFMGQPVWWTTDSGITNKAKYRAVNHIWCYNRWNVADPTTTKLGYLTDTISSHWGDMIAWEFSTQMLYNEGAGAIINSLELIATTGRIEFGKNPLISTSYSLDGITWSQEKYIRAGKAGEFQKRLAWFLQGSMKKFRIQKFKGDSDAMISIARLEAKLEPCYV